MDKNGKLPKAEDIYLMVSKGDPESYAYILTKFEEIGLHPKIAAYAGKQVVNKMKAVPAEKAGEAYKEVLNDAYRTALVNGVYDKITEEGAAKWLWNETQEIMRTMDGMWSDSQTKLTRLPGTPIKAKRGDKMEVVGKVEPGEEDTSLIPCYASALHAFGKARQSKHVKQTAPGSSGPVKDVLDQVATTTHFELYNPAVAHYGRALLVRRLRTKPEIFDTDEGYEWFQGMIGAMDFISDSMESDKLEYKLEFYKRLVENRRKKAGKGREKTGAAEGQ